MLYQQQCSFNVTRTTNGRRGRNMVENWTLMNFNKYCSSVNSSSSNSSKYVHDEIFGVKTTFCTPVVFRSRVGLCNGNQFVSMSFRQAISHHQRGMQSGHQQSICDQQLPETTADKKIGAHGRMNNKWQVQVKQKRKMMEVKKSKNHVGDKSKWDKKEKWQIWKKTNPVCWQN